MEGDSNPGKPGAILVDGRKPIRNIIGKVS